MDRFVYNQMVGKDSFFDRMDALVLEDARVAYKSEGREAAATYMQRAAKILGGEHHFLDRRGVDLVTGEDFSALAGKFRFEKGALQNLDGRVAAGVASDDGKYRLLVLGASRFPVGKTFRTIFRSWRRPPFFAGRSHRESHRHCISWREPSIDSEEAT